MYDKVASFVDWFFRFSVGLALFFAGGVVYVFTLMTLWNWFVATTFHISKLTLLQTYGLYGIFTILTWHFAVKPVEPGETVFGTIAMGFGRSLGACAGALGIGYIVHCWM